jgi:hypothetical protein
MKIFEYYDEGNRFSRYFYYFSFMMSSVLGIQVDYPAIGYSGWEKYIKSPKLHELFEFVGIFDPQLFPQIEYHNKRIKNRLIYALLVYIALALPFILSAIYFSNEIPNLLSLSLGQIIAKMHFPILAFFILIFLVLIFIFSIFIIFGLIARISVILVDYHYAETLCVYAIVNLLIELNRDNVLFRSDHRKRAQKRLNVLAQNTLMLAARYKSNDDNTQAWYRIHVLHIERFIRDRERWLMAPQDNTLANLRQSFKDMSIIYILGTYGDFDWPVEEPTEEKTKQSAFSRIANSIVKILGLVLPILIFGFLSFRPDLLEQWDINTELISLILIAWFLISLDAILKLGIVDRLLTVAKEIRELK